MKKKTKKSEIKEVKKVELTSNTISSVSLIEVNNLTKDGFKVIEVQSALIGIRPKTWILRKE